MARVNQFKKAVPLFYVRFSEYTKKWCVARNDLHQCALSGTKYLHSNGSIRNCLYRNGSASGWYNTEQDAIDSLDRWKKKETEKRMWPCDGLQS